MPTTALTRAGRLRVLVKAGARVMTELLASIASNASSSTDPTLTGSEFGDAGLLFTVAFSGPILFWLPASTELLCAVVGRRGSVPPLRAGFAGAAGQCALFALCYCFGERLAARWPWLRRRISMSGDKLARKGGYAMTTTAGVVGFPPTVPLFTLAPSLHMRLLPMITIVFLARFVRFAAICRLGGLPFGAVAAAAASSSKASSSPETELHASSMLFAALRDMGNFMVDGGRVAAGEPGARPIDVDARL
jgi:membrane protein YqaA with SNARE-associated domain